MAWLMPWVMETVPARLSGAAGAAVAILRFGNTVVATRYDDVREVFLNDPAFRVPYDGQSRRHHGRASVLPRAWTTRRNIARDTAAMRQGHTGRPISPAPRPGGRAAGREDRRRREWAARGRRCPRAAGHVRACYGAYFGIPESAGRRLARLGDPAVRIPVRRYRQRSRAARRGRCDRAGPARPHPGPHGGAPGIAGERRTTCSAAALPCRPQGSPASTTARSAAR